MTTKRNIFYFILIGLMIAVLSGAVIIASIKNMYDKQSQGFVDALVPVIAADWDMQVIRNHASKEFNATIDYDTLEQFLELLHGLGELQQYNGSIGEATITISLLHGIIITADFEASADFESGSAEILISLVKRDDRWQILGFTVNPGESEEQDDVI
ncbi:MAG: hypothetical protein WC539_05310 [Nitrospirota bacterium]